MQRTNYSSRRYYDDQYEQEDDEEQYTSDEPPESDDTNSRYSARPNNPRRSRPPPRREPTNEVSFFSGASNFEINGGSFTAIGGNSYNGAPAGGPWGQPSRPSVPRSKTNTTFFPNATGFRINNGKFSSVDGDYYNVTTNTGHQGQPVPPQAFPSYQPHPTPNQNRGTRSGVSSAPPETWARQRTSPREQTTPSFRQNEASLSPPIPSSQSPPINLSSSQRYGGTQQFERIHHSQSAPPLSNNPATPEDVEEDGDIESDHMPLEPLPPSTSVPVISQYAPTAPTSPFINGTVTEATAPANVLTPVPPIGRTMTADINEERSGTMPNKFAGPIGNRYEPLISATSVGESSAQMLETGTGHVSTSQEGNLKPKFGKPWNLLNKGKGKGKK